MNKKLKVRCITTACLLFVFFIVSGSCATFFNTPFDELDKAIRDTSNYLNENIPRGSKIVILNIQSEFTALSEYIIEELISNAVNDVYFTVVSRHQLDAIRAQFNIQYSGEVDNNRAVEIGRYFGAQTIVTGRFIAVGRNYRLTVSAINTQTATVQGQFNRNMASSEAIVTLIGTDLRISNAPSGAGQTPAAPQNTSTVAQPQQQRTTQPAAQTTGLRPGTYTFWPRITATMNGIPINDAYIDKIVVRGNNMLIYITAVPRGTSSSGARGHNTAAGFKCTLTDLDRPSRSWHQIGAAHSGNEGVIVSFQNVTATRLSLETEYWNGTVVFENFTLGEPDAQ